MKVIYKYSAYEIASDGSAIPLATERTLDVPTCDETARLFDGKTCYTGLHFPSEQKKALERVLVGLVGLLYGHYEAEAIYWEVQNESDGTENAE